MKVLRQDCCPCVNENSPCASKLSIRYDWSGTGMRDLDTGTTFLGTTVGYACSGGDYIDLTTGDDTSIDGREIVEVDVLLALEDLQWSSSVTIDLAAGWYTPAGGSGNAVVIVSYCGQPDQQKIITPGDQTDCAATNVGTVTFYDDGTFELV